MAKTKKGEKKKKSLFRRILKWTGITLLVLIAAIIIIPIVFKDEIKEMVEDQINASFKEEVKLNVGDVDLTFLSTFPNLTVELNDITIEWKKGEFKGAKLADIKLLQAHVGLWDVIGGDQITVDEVHVTDASFDVRVTPEGVANYDITLPSDELPSEDTTAFKLSLQEYTLNNVNIVYDDQAGDMYANIKNLNHAGTGDMTADVIDFQTHTEMDELTCEMEGLSYLSKVKTVADANLLMEFTDKTSKFTLKENKFDLNNFSLSLDGFYEMLEDHDMMDLKMNTNQVAFKDLLSLVPTFYQSGYESMVAKGDVKLGGFVKGRMDEKNMPGWDFNLDVSKASIKYAGVPGSINNIAVKAGSKFVGGENMDKMTIDVDKFHADFVGNVIDANLKMRNPMTDPLLDAKLLAKVDLATLGKVMPLTEGESYSGKLNADVVVNGRMSALEKGDYEAFKALGTLELFDMLYKSADLPDPVNISKMVFRFSPKNLALEQLQAKMGKSDFAVNGTIDNYMGYIFRDELLKGNFNFTSNYLDLDQLMGTSSTTASTATTDHGAVAEGQSPAAESTEAGDPVLIPDNVDFTLNTNIGKVRYNGIDINDITGNVNMKEEVASLNNMSMKTMGGTVGLKGSYNTKDHHKPVIDFGYSLADIDIQQLSSHFLTIEKLAPVAKYAKGKISSNFDMHSALTSNLEPIYSSLNGGGNFFSKMVTISGFEPLKKLGDELRMDKLATQTIKDVNAKFKFADGKLSLTPFLVKLGGINTTVSGSTSFEQAIDYKLAMAIPKEMIPAGIVKNAEAAMDKVNGMVPKLNIGSFPEIINVNALIGGTVTDPKVSTDFRDQILKATGNFKDNLKEQGKELVNKAKDSLKTIAKEKVEEVREDLNKKKQEIIDDAQKQADKVKAEAKRAADNVRAEADKQAKALMDEAGNNPVKKKAAEIAGKKLKKEAEEKAAKIESEGEAKADGIMTKAREKADQVK